MSRLLQRLCGFAALLLSALPAHAQPSVTGVRQPCVDGVASGYACDAVDLMAFLSIEDMGGAQAELNDIWGWTDETTGKEYALVGRTDGTAMVDLTDPLNPAFLGLLPRTDGSNPSSWRDIKTYANHAFVVSEAGAHGMQVFDLTQLRGLAASPTRLFSESGRYDGITSAHNVVINEETGFAYAVGSRASLGGPACGRGLHMIDIRTPTAPVYAGCFNDPETGRNLSGYSHDAQCVVYRGPDARYSGREICLGSNETALSIADVTDKASPQKVSSLSYPNAAYTHQGWLSEDQRYFFVGDELDERGGGTSQTRTLVFDLLELDSPVLINEHAGVSTSIDHNQYVVERYSFQANYTSGLRILDVSDPTSLKEVAFFDTYTPSNTTIFLGLWSVYPFFASRNVIVSDIEQGLFILRPTALTFRTATAETAYPTEGLSLSIASALIGHPTTLLLTLDRAGAARVEVYDATGRQVMRLAEGTLAAGAHAVAFDPAGLASGTYFVRAVAGAAHQTTSVVVAR